MPVISRRRGGVSELQIKCNGIVVASGVNSIDFGDWFGNMISTGSGVTLGSPTTSTDTDRFNWNCSPDIELDDLVYVVGRIDDHVVVGRVNIRDKITIPAIGIVVNKPTSDTCEIRVMGAVITQMILEPGSRYFVGASGKPSVVSPIPLNGGIAVVQEIGVAASPHVLLFNPTNRAYIRSD